MALDDVAPLSGDAHGESSSSQPAPAARSSSSRKRQSEGACYVPSSLSPAECRRKRKKYLDQKKFVSSGSLDICAAPSLGCGRFTQQYIDALKDSYVGRSSYGMPDYECRYCHAMFWLRECSSGQSTVRGGRIVYNKCCKGGKVVIPPFRKRPEPLASLARFDGDARCKQFLKNIRQYNCLFAFTSMGANIDRSMNDGRGPPVFKISGQVHHRIGSLLPEDGTSPKFLQLYIYDTANEVRNRLHALNPDERPSEPLDPLLVESLLKMLDDHNPLAKQFRLARDRLAENGDEEFIVRIIGAKEGDPVQYNLPTTDQLAMLVVGDFSLDTYQRDIIVQARSGQLRHISSLHPAFMALQYPLLFPYGERGYQVGVVYDGMTVAGKNAHVKVTMQDFFRHGFHYRKNQPNPFLCYGALSTQAKVDARACVDENRLWYILQNQGKLRVESLQGIVDAVDRGCTDGAEIGKKTVLPASHTGGRRYMIQNYHDGIAICRVHGPPDFFVTFTCNPKWPEISAALSFEPGQKSTDRADIVVRVYNMKLEELLADIKTGAVFGPVSAVLHTVEFQKRGLPHAHIIIWLTQDTSHPTPAFIDKFICAEIPDPRTDPLAYVLVAEHMVHGPCGPGYETCPCMKNGKCSKRFPKKYQSETSIDDGGFAQYRRSNNMRYVEKGPKRLDSGWVVPYNMFLLKKYQAHINVEWCNKGIFIKYLFKYVTKGPDRGKVYIQRIRSGEPAPYDEQTKNVNEVKEYLDCRYICEQDACWRIFGFDIHRHYPSVERLPVHLPDDNCIVYDAEADITNVASEEFLRKTMLTEWFVANQNSPAGRDLTYCEFPSKWKWDTSSRFWDHRRRAGGKIGRLYYVHPSVGERYFLRMLLLVVKGAKSYEDVRRYNGVLYPTFKLACNARGLLGDDQEWYDAFDEAAAWATSSQLRKLFVTMLMFCEVRDECAFFEKVWRLLADDIQYRLRDIIGNPEFQVPDTDLRNYLLDDLSALFSRNGARLRDHSLPEKTNSSEGAYGNRLIEEELAYDAHQLMSDAEDTVRKLNSEQLSAFKTITETVLDNRPGFFFVSGYGGTGKTFLWGAIVAWLRARKKIVLTVASSGVASLLLPGGRTAHSRFKLPCDLDDSSICDIKRGSMLCELIESASLVIWDEALMTHRHAFEALDRTFRDLLSWKTEHAAGLVFGGKVVVLGGDLRQILPVVEGGDRAQGNAMYGEIPGPEVEAKSPLIEEGAIYIISRFRVSNAKFGYRPVDARFMVEFTLHTTISAARNNMPDFPAYAYKITPINELSSHAGDTRNFLDTIGVLVEVSDAYMVHLPNKPAPTLTRHIILRDLSYSEMKVTLWGQRATAFTTDGVYNNVDAKPIVVLFVGGLMKSFQNNYYLSANTASRWYFNPSIPEARQFYASLHNQKLEIRSVPAPPGQNDQTQVPTQLGEKTLRELNQMDPYEFAENGYRCTVTIGRLVPNASWWFPSCSKCSRSCVADGAGYRCIPCSSTSFKFKYKLCFVALDGTDEAEMICFGDVARRMIGKPVQQVLRTAISSNAYPADITRMVSLRFTFAVKLTQQSYYRAQKSYQVASIVTSHGHQVVVPHAAGNGDDDRAPTPGSDDVLSGDADDNTDQRSPDSLPGVGLSSPVAAATPPPPVDITETPVAKSSTGDKSAENTHPTAQKRLLFEKPGSSDQAQLPEDSLQKNQPAGETIDDAALDVTDKGIVADKNLAPEKKRPRGSRSLAQESG